MIGVRSELKVLVASRPIDFRRGVHGLVALVAQALGADPYCGNIFVFRSKRKDRLKILTWDGTGMVRKRYEHTPVCPGCPGCPGCLGCSGDYLTRANRLGIQNWRMASTTAGMSRHDS